MNLRAKLLLLGLISLVTSFSGYAQNIREPKPQCEPSVGNRIAHETWSRAIIAQHESSDESLQLLTEAARQFRSGGNHFCSVVVLSNAIPILHHQSRYRDAALHFNNLSKWSDLDSKSIPTNRSARASAELIRVITKVNSIATDGGDFWHDKPPSSGRVEQSAEYFGSNNMIDEAVDLEISDALFWRRRESYESATDDRNMVIHILQRILDQASTLSWYGEVRLLSAIITYQISGRYMPGLLEVALKLEAVTSAHDSARARAYGQAQVARALRWSGDKSAAALKWKEACKTFELARDGKKLEVLLGKWERAFYSRQCVHPDDPTLMDRTLSNEDHILVGLDSSDQIRKGVREEQESFFDPLAMADIEPMSAHGSNRWQDGKVGDLQSFVPDGYAIVDKAVGDLDGRESEDALVVIGKDSEPGVSRAAMILLGRGAGYVKATECKNAVMSSGDGGMWPEPLAGLLIEKGVFSVNHYGGSGGGRWKEYATFRYDPTRGDWFLIKSGSSGYKPYRDQIVHYTAPYTPHDFGEIRFSNYDVAQSFSYQYHYPLPEAMP